MPGVSRAGRAAPAPTRGAVARPYASVAVRTRRGPVRDRNGSGPGPERPRCLSGGPPDAAAGQVPGGCWRVFGRSPARRALPKIVLAQLCKDDLGQGRVPRVRVGARSGACRYGSAWFRLSQPGVTAGVTAPVTVVVTVRRPWARCPAGGGWWSPARFSPGARSGKHHQEHRPVEPTGSSSPPRPLAPGWSQGARVRGGELPPALHGRLPVLLAVVVGGFGAAFARPVRRLRDPGCGRGCDLVSARCAPEPPRAAAPAVSVFALLRTVTRHRAPTLTRGGRVTVRQPRVTVRVRSRVTVPRTGRRGTAPGGAPPRLDLYSAADSESGSTSPGTPVEK